MLRVVAHKSAAAASQYYAEGLKREDYYSEGQEIAGKWFGKAAERLGLSGKVTPEQFSKLVENRHPGTGKQLTPRMKADRVVGYDINFHAPKSLSILHALTQDADILKAFRSAVSETMADIERQASTRIRKNFAQTNRSTGNLVWAEFTHFTARPVGGVPDPHLHSHCFTFNATFDDAEGRWKAAKFRQIKQEAPYNEAAFHARLATKLAALGYGIERSPTGWEIEGIPRSLVKKFSRRTEEIERLAEERGITDAKVKDGLGALSRAGKRHGLTYSDLLAEWGGRMTEAEKVLVSKLRFDRELRERPAKVTPGQAIDYALEKSFSKNSVVEQNRLVAEALRFAIGSVKPEQVWKELDKRDLLVKRIGDQNFCTTMEVLEEEVALIRGARSGRGLYAPLCSGKIKLGNEVLSREQKEAVRHILGSKDQVIALRGGAGVGKTTLMKEAAAQIEAAGLRIFAFAPSASASRETLREAGFAGAETVAHFLHNKKLQNLARGHVIWIDEAGLLGIRELSQVMALAGTSTRVILTGDSGQHAPVARGDAFRLLQKYAGLKIAEVMEVRRQEHATYKAAVTALSRGELGTAFQSLDGLGAVVEVADERERYRLLATDFLALSRKGRAPLVVSPTHAESRKVTEAIREVRREAGQIKSERLYSQYHNLQWENVDKRRAESYAPGQLVQFHQNVSGIKRGELFRIDGVEGGSVRMVGADGREKMLPLSKAERFQVFEERQIELGRGDLIRITRNGESQDGRRLNNGSVHEIEKIRKNGDLVLKSGAVLDAKHGHLAYGYCQTSHSSQSKSVRDVLVAQSEDSFLASSREQFYVSVSRGKETIRIYTDNREGLQRAVGNSSIRESGLEFAGLKKRDLAAMSDDELSSRKFRDLVKRRHEEGQVKHEEALKKELKLDAGYKDSTKKWQEHVKARRALPTGGKGRSYGGKQDFSKEGSEKAFRYRSFLRPTEAKTETTKKSLEAHEKKKAGELEPALPNKEHAARRRMADALVSGVKHFNKFMKSEKSAGLSMEKAVQKGKEVQAAIQSKISEKMSAVKEKLRLPKPSLKQAVNHELNQQKPNPAPPPPPQVPPPTKTKVVVPPPAPKK